MEKEQWVPGLEVSEGPVGLKRPWPEVSGGKREQTLPHIHLSSPQRI